MICSLGLFRFSFGLTIHFCGASWSSWLRGCYIPWLETLNMGLRMGCFQSWRTSVHFRVQFLTFCGGLTQNLQVLKQAFDQIVANLMNLIQYKNKKVHLEFFLWPKITKFKVFQFDFIWNSSKFSPTAERRLRRRHRSSSYSAAHQPIAGLRSVVTQFYDGAL